VSDNGRMAYEGQRQVEVGFRENLAGCKACEHYDLGVCCFLGYFGWPWRERVAPRRLLEGVVHSLHEDYEVPADKNLLRGWTYTDEVALGLCCEARRTPCVWDVAAATKTKARHPRLYFRSLSKRWISPYRNSQVSASQRGGSPFPRTLTWSPYSGYSPISSA